MTTPSLMLGATLIAAIAAIAALGQGGGFHFSGPLSRVVTPNGDGLNDVAIFCFDNPSDSGVSGTIYSLLGSKVAALASPLPAATPPPVPGAAGPVSCPGGFLTQYQYWDGRSNGSLVHSGVYVYQIRAEEKNYTGTLLVIR